GGPAAAWSRTCACGRCWGTFHERVAAAARGRQPGAVQGGDEVLRRALHPVRPRQARAPARPRLLRLGHAARARRRGRPVLRLRPAQARADGAVPGPGRVRAVARRVAAVADRARWRPGRGRVRRTAHPVPGERRARAAAGQHHPGRTGALVPRPAAGLVWRAVRRVGAGMPGTVGRGRPRPARRHGLACGGNTLMPEWLDLRMFEGTPVLALIGLVIAAWLSWYVASRIVARVLARLAQASPTHWDDAMI